MIKNIYLLLVFAVSLITLPSCNDDNSTNPLDTKLKVAAIIDLSGHYNQFGIEEKQAIEIALNDVKNISVEYYDSKGDEIIAEQILDSIIAKGNTNVVITQLSWVSNKLAEKIYNNNMLQVAIASAAFDYQTLNSCVRFTGDVTKESLFLAEQLSKYDKIAVLYFENDYGISWVKTLKTQLGEKIVATKSYIDTQSDFTSELEFLNESKPKAIVLISTKEAANIVKKAKELGITSQMIGTRPTLTNQLLAEPTAVGLIFSYPDLNEDLEVYQNFLNKYKYRMSAFGAEGYDLIITLNQAYQNNNKDRNVLFNNIKNKSYKGALGDIIFSEHSQADYGYCFMIIENGTFKKL